MNIQTIKKVGARLRRTPKHLGEIAMESGVEPRIVKEAIRELRIAGVPIVSGQEGYWMWNGKDESWKNFIAQMNKEKARKDELIDAMVEASAKRQLLTVKDAIEELSK